MLEIKDPELYSITKKFGESALRRSSYNELYRFILNHNIKGNVCYEIGTLNGITAIILSRYFNKVISVDIKERPYRDKIIDFLGIKNIEFRLIRNNEEKDIHDKYDFAYVDGNRVDAIHDFEIVKKCKRVLFHDYYENEPVWHLMKTLPKEETIIQPPMAYWYAR